MLFYKPLSCRQFPISQMLFLTSLYCWVFACTPSAQNGTSIVETTYGKVQGFTALNDSIDVFFGIPFASPPVGQNRFEKPVSPKKWDGILPTMELRNGCYSHATPDWLTAFLLSGNSSEDCLYLNIFSPHESCKFLSLFKPLLPVLVIIHGGGFEIGSALEFANYTDIGTNFVQNGIVVVSIQYRLGEFGFASTGDKVMPGNLGLWDQVAALKFIKANIAKFGGDPNQITLFGQSAGSASVSALGLSPHSRNLFQKAIQLSGSSTASFVYGSRVAKETAILAHVLGCPPRNSTAIKQCLNATSAQALLAGVDNMGPTRPEPNPILFGPRFDGDFFPVDIPELIKQAAPKPTIVGFNRQEALIFTFLTGMNSTLSSQQLPWSVAGTYNANDFMDYINTQVAFVERFGNAQGDVAQQIFAYYTNAQNGQTKNSTFYIRAYTQLISDLMFIESIIGEAKQKAAHKWPIYLYESTYANEAQFPPAVAIHESTHMNDMNYVFNFPFVSYPFNAQDYRIQAFMQESFRNFIKTGNPSTSESIKLKWPKVPRNGELIHVDIRAPEPVVLNNLTYVQNSFNFWTRLTVEFPQYNLVREIPGTV